LEIEVKDLRTDCKQLEVKVQELKGRLQESAAQQIFDLKYKLQESWYNAVQQLDQAEARSSKVYTEFPDFDILIIFMRKS